MTLKKIDENTVEETRKIQSKKANLEEMKTYHEAELAKIKQKLAVFD